MTREADLNLSELNPDGSHVIVKKGSESVTYQRRKKVKTTNILPISDGHGFMIATTGLIAGNHNDAYNLKAHIQANFKSLKRLALDFQGAYFNADKAFDTKDARKTCFNLSLIPKRMRTSVISRPQSVVVNGFSMPKSTNSVLLLKDHLLRFINSKLCR